MRKIGGEAALCLAPVEPAPIAEAVETLIVDAVPRERLAAEGRARVERLFGVGRVATELDDFCAEVIERANRRAAPTAAITA